MMDQTISSEAMVGLGERSEALLKAYVQHSCNRKLRIGVICGSTTEWQYRRYENVYNRTENQNMVDLRES